MSELNVVMYRAWADEMEKIAAPRWKQMLRAGELAADGVAKLRSAQRPGGGSLLDYGREIAGLNKGTEEIARKHGLKIKRVGGKELLGGVKDVLQGRGADRLKDVARTGGIASVGGGYAAVPLFNTAFTAPGLSPLGKGLKGQSREALEALATRHEIDELRTGAKAIQRAASTGKSPHTFIPGRAPEGLRERAATKLLDAQRKGFDLAEKNVHRLPVEKRDALRMGLQAAKAQAPVASGTLPAGKHMSPEVILRESRNVATLPPEVAQAMSKFRKGETQTMGPLGFSYGREAPVQTRSSILKAFERKEI